MNGFADKGLDESNFGGDDKSSYNVVKAFDAFPKTKPNYTEKTSQGGIWTIVLVCASILLTWSEMKRWWVGYTTHSFSVEQGIGRDLQINLDVVVGMQCDDLHVNLQDASGDRIMARQALKTDPTTWIQWRSPQMQKMFDLMGGNRRRVSDVDPVTGKRLVEYREDDVHDHLGAVKTSKAFKKTPRVPRGMKANSCRIYGTMHTNKVQGDFHITARGHGYHDFSEHLDHSVFNFSHYVNELSFGPYYPSLTNPLDKTFATTDSNFFKYQYYLSVVPTIYTTDARSLRHNIDKYHESPSSGSDGLDQHPHGYSRNTVFTNQYAVTEQSYAIHENMAPGIFVKFDIEPILLTIAEEWSSVPALFIRLVNVISGVLVAGGWCFQLSHWAKDARRLRRSTLTTDGILSPGGGIEEKEALYQG